MPSILLVPFHYKHVVGKVNTKTQVIRGWFLLPLIQIHFFECNFKVFPHLADLLNTTIFSLLNPMNDIYFFNNSWTECSVPINDVRQQDTSATGSIATQFRITGQAGSVKKQH